ncbi:hypothetical protein [Streptomyces sporangiiformans]|uniref:Uncharacterized protein n=1 Tax=Streptomyces sporangiiformans TaxID=2315329 RepID=A0A505DKB4_9ACTN|nr:hypothetical protein [Streptomyces sporangiiformans]TPQ21818.1 hypothetical protein FGD71_013035 [Streptomyces sporangiiformans]
MVKVFDADRQEWAGPDEEQRIVALQRRDAALQRQVLRGAVVGLSVCGLAFGTWALGWKDEPQPAGYFVAREVPPEQNTKKDGTDGTGTEGTASPSPTGGPPFGYAAVADPYGFRVAVNKDWNRTTSDSQHGFRVVHYRSADGSRRLQIYKVREATPYASLQEYVSDPNATPQGFDQLSLDPLDEDGRPAARLEYLADSLRGESDIGGTWHVIDHRFESVDGQLYALTSYGPAADGYDDEQEVLDAALSWFCPPDTECPEPASG